MSETNGYLSPFIHDGLDRVGEVPESPGRWSACKFRYRPLSADEESVIHSKLRIAERSGQPASMARLYAEAFAGQAGIKGNLLDWDVKDANGHKINVSVDTLCRLHPGFFDALLVTISGAGVLPSNETEREAEAKNSAAASGQSS